MKKTWHKWAVAFIATLGLSNVALADDEWIKGEFKALLAEVDNYCTNNPDSKLCSTDRKMFEDLCSSKNNTQEAAFACVKLFDDETNFVDIAYKACEKRLANSSISKKVSAGCNLALLDYIQSVYASDVSRVLKSGERICKHKNDTYFKKFVSNVDAKKTLGAKKNLTVKDMHGFCSVYEELTKK